MTSRLLSRFTSVACLILALGYGPAKARADSMPSAPAPLVGDHYQGQVIKAADANNAFVITSRYGERTINVTTSPDTQFVIMHLVSMDDLQVGDKVLVDGRPDKDGAINALLIIQLPSDAGENARGNGKVAKRMVFGSIATLTPALTLTAPDGKVTTVNTEPRTRVSAPEDGTAQDLAVGNMVEVVGSPTGPSTFAATMVRKLAPGNQRPKQPKARPQPVNPPANPPANQPPPANNGAKT